MKTVLFISAFVLLLGLASSQTIWSQLVSAEGSDAGAYTALGYIFDRAVGFALGDPCLNRFFYTPGIEGDLRYRFLAFLCTAFGGNSITNQSSLEGCYYYSVNNQTLYFSENLTLALTQTFGPIHMALNISQGEQEYFKAVIGLVAQSYGVAGSLLGQIAAILNATDSFVVSNAASVNCANPSIAANITWKNPITQSVTIQTQQTVCFNWADGLDHSIVNGAGSASISLGGFGTGTAADSVAANTPCSSTSAGDVPCTQLVSGGTFFRYCHTFYFDSPGTYIFNCGVHGTAMAATVVVGTGGASASSSPASGGTTTTTGSTGTSGANTLSSFLF